jgi:hypothetical protein
MGSILCPKKKQVSEVRGPLLLKEDEKKQDVQIIIKKENFSIDESKEKMFITNLK